jgi:hypothetical protein
MNRRILAVTCILTLGISAGFAQNARLNSMRGFTLFGDVSDVLYNPAFMTQYTDLIQATYQGTDPNAQGIGPVIGIKSVGDVLALGLTYEPTTTAVEQVPHFLVGIGTDMFSVGADLFFGREISSDVQENADTAGTNIIENERTNMRLGGEFGLTLDLDAAALAVAVGLQIPYEKTYSLTDPLGDPIDETERTTTSLFLDGYAEAVLHMDEIALTIGVTGQMDNYGRPETYHKEWRAADAAIWDTTYEAGNFVKDIGLGFYVGMVKSFEQSGLDFGGQLSGRWLMHKEEPEEMGLGNYNPGATSNNLLALGINGAVEKEWSELKRLDAIFARSGLSYGVGFGLNKEEGDTAAWSHTRDVNTASTRVPSNGFGWSIGMGILKGVFAADVDVAPVAIINAFKLANGNSSVQDLVSLTLTLDFKNLKGSGSSSSSMSSPAPAPAPAEETDTGGGYEYDF